MSPQVMEAAPHCERPAAVHAMRFAGGPAASELWAEQAPPPDFGGRALDGRVHGAASAAAPLALARTDMAELARLPRSRYVLSDEATPETSQRCGVALRRMASETLKCSEQLFARCWGFERVSLGSDFLWVRTILNTTSEAADLAALLSTTPSEEARLQQSPPSRSVTCNVPPCPSCNSLPLIMMRFPPVARPLILWS